MVYKTEADLERLLKYNGMMKENLLLLVKFDQEFRALKKAITYRSLFICTLRKVDEILKKPFKKVTKDDMIKFLSIRASQKSNNDKKCTRIFFQWLHGCPKGKLPPCVEWIKFGHDYRKKLPEEMLTRDDILNMVQVSPHLRDKALIYVLYETGARSGEVVDMRIKHIKFDQMTRVTKPNGSIVEWIPVFLRGKTGERQVYIQDSIKILKDFLNEHPTPQNPEAPLFPAKSGGFISGANVLGQILDRATSRAGIKKRVHPHLFRHSRATELAKSMTEQELKQWFGWTGGSQMPAIYTHLGAGNLLEKLKKNEGITKETVEENPLAPVNCHACGEINRAGASFCVKCGAPHNLDTAMEERRKQKQRMEFLDRLMTDVKFKALRDAVFD